MTVAAEDNLCSLSEAVANANADAQVGNDDCVAGSGADVITLSPGMVHVLSAPLPVVTSAIIVEGNQAVVQRSDLATCNADGVTDFGEFRLWELASGELSLRDLTLRFGCADGPSGEARTGGAVLASGGSLALERVVVRDSRSRRSAGGVQLIGANAAIVDSILRDNVAGHSGGGLAVGSGSTVVVDGSTITGNFGRGSGGGGLSNGGTILIVNTTIHDNETDPSEEFSGGGGLTNFGSMTLANVTITGNRQTGIGVGGGGLVIGGTVSIRNSIIADNPQGGDCLYLFGTFLAEDANLDSDGSCLAADPANFTTVTVPALALGPLGDNGGPTPTRQPAAGSAAVDAVATCTLEGEPLTVDQRGVSRPQFAACDLGAVELAPSIFADGFES